MISTLYFNSLLFKMIFSAIGLSLWSANSFLLLQVCQFGFYIINNNNTICYHYFVCVCLCIVHVCMRERKSHSLQDSVTSSLFRVLRIYKVLRKRERCSSLPLYSRPTLLDKQCLLMLRTTTGTRCRDEMDLRWSEKFILVELMHCC